ncbi:MAG: hypothetical protein KKF79_19390 [Gammaproteobacteria bacterium]|nr:hypothetical protein [Gammaproteobacteria bacterium]
MPVRREQHWPKSPRCQQEQQQRQQQGQPTGQRGGRFLAHQATLATTDKSNF